MSWCLQCSILSIIGLSIFLIQYAHRCLCSFHICSLTSLSTFEGMPYFHVLVLLYLYNHISAYDPKYSRIICIGIDNRYSAINPSKFFIHTVLQFLHNHLLSSVLVPKSPSRNNITYFFFESFEKLSSDKN